MGVFSNFFVPGNGAGILVLETLSSAQRRGVYPAGYADGALRQKLFGRGAGLPATHVGKRAEIARKSAVV